MKIRINNKETEVEASTLLALAEETKLPERGIAVAVNTRMVPRTEWAGATIKEGDSIVIIKAVCGG